MTLVKSAPSENFRSKELFLLAACLLMLLIFGCAARADDGIFPPLPAAKSAISFDGRGFLIGGQRTFIASGGMEYARVPRGLWRDRLLRMKRAGLNCTEMYVFWNFHEPREGAWNFSGDHDLNAYLKLVHELGMYAIVRVGPYVCAEWDSGGFPVWLRFKQGLRIREDNPQYLAEVDKYYDHVIPIVAANQINHGGSVILVQIENEYHGGWGTEGDSYEQHLRQKALSLGIEVPTFFSGLHHGGDPPGNTPWDDSQRANPWMTTEFWTDWFTVYGPCPPDRLNRFVRSTWKIIAFGGNGYNYYMFHGGTNFETYNNDEDASSYDYGASIGQAGDLRPIYYEFKKAALFARTFQDILENSVNSSAQYASLSSNPAIDVIARSGPAGTIAFLDNPTAAPVQTAISDAPGFAPGTVTIPAGQMLPIVMNFRLSPDFTIDHSSARILTLVTNRTQAGNATNTTVVVYGPPGEQGALDISSRLAITTRSKLLWDMSDPHHAMCAFTYPADGQKSLILNAAGSHLQVLVLSDDEAGRTWPVTSDGRTFLITGPDYVGDASITQDAVHAVAEYRSLPPADTTLFLPDLTSAKLRVTAVSAAPEAPALTGWREHPVVEQSPSFDDSSWLPTIDPEQMGADGDYSAYAWYRAPVNAPDAGAYDLSFSNVRDRMIVFVDGNRVPDSQVAGSTASLSLSTGAHEIAVLAAHYGRDKFNGYSGPITDHDAKGLSGTCTLAGRPVQNWRMRGGIGDYETFTGWTPLTQNDPPGAPCFYEAHFTAPANAVPGFHPIWRVHLGGMSAGFVWLNGHNLGRYPEKIPVDGIYLPECWIHTGANTLCLFDEDGNVPSGVKLSVEQAASRNVAVLTN